MSSQSRNVEQQAIRPRVRVRVEQADAESSAFTFTDAFRIGRGTPCELRIDSGLVSRVHAEVVFEKGAWWVRDLESTNGIYLDDKKVQQVCLHDQTTLRLGRNGPFLHITINPSEVRSEAAAAPAPARPFPARPGEFRAATFRQHTKPEVSAPSSGLHPPPEPPRPSAPDPLAPDPSLSQIIGRYFEADSDQPAGDRTRMIRQAYASVKKKQQRKYTWIIAGVLGLLVVALGYIVYQEIRLGQLKAKGAVLFTEMKNLDLEAARLRRVVEETGAADVREQLRDLEERRRRQTVQYKGYVRELGTLRRLSEEEKRIYETARIFNESAFEVSASFIREVKRMIHEYWQQDGRMTFITGIRRAKENNFIPYIVETMQRHGLPPEFFYLALQESVFDTMAVGPSTNWGIARGMWQFIPSTAEQYGLVPGPRAHTRFEDPQDERHHFKKSTEAAARYLQYIYSTPAQASGLLVMASYNWGERRVIKKLETLSTSQEAIDAVFEGLAEDPKARNYWRFLNEYEDRMPEETKEYVLKIFSAAVIGQDPRRYGFDFDNPLEPYLETPQTQAD